jgi:hypothetical protein
LEGGIVEEPTIGIKLADGTYYPVVTEGEGTAKRLILTTVKDNQQSVQIDFYRGGKDGKSVVEGNYLGSLLVEEVSAAAEGGPEIELKMQLDEKGDFHAEAIESATGERQSLSLNLEALEAGENYEIPDFDLEEPLEEGPLEEGPTDFSVSSDLEDLEENILGEDDLSSQLGDTEEQIEEGEIEEERSRVHPFLLIGFVALGLAAIVLLAILLFRLFQGPEIPPLKAGNGQKTEQAAETSTEKDLEKDAETTEASSDAPEEASDEADTAADAEAAPADTSASTSASEEAEKEGDDEIGGVWYRIRRGDTLWDLSAAFYRTPWLYGKIAKENNIKDPDLIFAGNKIFIPEQ